AGFHGHICPDETSVRRDGCNPGPARENRLMTPGRRRLARFVPTPLRRAVARVRGWPARRNIGLMMIAFLPLAWLLALGSLQVNDILEGPTTRTKATVLEVHHESGDRVQDHIIVRFQTADGRDVRLRMTRYWWHDPVVGSAVPIEYAERGTDV